MAEYYSNGKLLLTGEYLVLDGASALALPTKFGQSLEVINHKDPILHLRSLDENEDIWFECKLDLFNLKSISKSSNNEIEKRLIQILTEARNLNSDFLSNDTGFQIETKLDFPRNWGLGTSSTLINNIASWAKIDPYTLLAKTFGGSGYDIACAQNDSALIYKIEKGEPIVCQVNFNPEFKEHLYFVYLNRKRNSRKAIVQYRDNKDTIETKIETMNGLTDLILKSESLVEFSTLIEAHENLIGSILKEMPIKRLLFNDFQGSVKSLGAWGGDFALVISEENPMPYFNKRGFNTIIPFEDMILS